MTALATTRSKLSVTWAYDAGECFDTYTINGCKFAVFSSEIRCTEDIEIDLSDYTVVLPKPIAATKGISIVAKNVLAASDLSVSDGNITIKTGNFWGLGAHFLADRCSVVASNKCQVLGSELKGRIFLEVKGAFGKDILGCPSEKLDSVKKLFSKSLEETDGLLFSAALVKTAMLFSIQGGERPRSALGTPKMLEALQKSHQTRKALEFQKD
jgi:hypothetical protein